MASISGVAELAVNLAEGCAKILVPLLCFLGGPSPRSPAADRAAVSLLVVLPTAYVAGVIVPHFAGVVLAHLPLVATAPAAGSSEYLGQFVGLFFTLLFAWLLAFAVLLFFLIAGKPGTGPGYVQLEHAGLNE